MSDKRRLTPYELGERLRLDFRACQGMFGSLFSGEAYATTEDMELRRNPVTSVHEGHLARKYRVDFRVKTLVRPGKYLECTTIVFDLEVNGYPFEEPATWIISHPIPYSPHFKRGSPVCIGKIWAGAKGHMLLGHLLVHIAKLLNWDEVARGGGYVGWNEEAVIYYNQIYKGRPITAGLHYPVLPADIYNIQANPLEPETPLIRRSLPLSSTTPTDAIFKGKGRMP